MRIRDNRVVVDKGVDRSLSSVIQVWEIIVV